MKLQALFAVLVLAAAVSLESPASAQAQTDDEINQARLKGVEFLKSQQKEDGSWEYESHPVGITALCTLALLENGLSVSDPAITNGRRFVRKNIADLKGTYDLSLAVLLLSRMGNREDRNTIRDLAARLVTGQYTSGGWSYTCPEKVDASVLGDRKLRPKPRTGPGDNSCTQFAVLGLWTASRSSVDINESMLAVAQRFIDSQNEDGGWSYRLSTPEMVEPSRDAMTFAGLFCLTVARAARIRQLQKDSRTTTSDDSKKEGDTLMEDPIYARGLDRAGQYAKGISTGSAKYYLWSVERLGVLLGLEEFGDTDWFNKGAAALLKTQGADGAWASSRGPLVDTSFAVLFLRKANLGSDISRLLKGEPEQEFQIFTQKEKPRFSTLDEALEATQPGDTIRIDGNGPYKLPHVTLEKDLTLQAGFGYQPALQYAIGFTNGRLRADPRRDANTRHMLKVAKGTLTLEGLRLEMDAPEIGATVRWQAIAVDGGNLRLLNCSISEANRKGMAAVVLSKPGTVEIYNSMLIGGRAAVEVIANGKQSVSIGNSLIFSDRAFITYDGPNSTPKPELKIDLSNCTVQTAAVYDLRSEEGKIEITSNNSIYKSDWLGYAMLKAPGKADDRSYSGASNVYNVGNWLGVQGRPEASVKDVASWNKFWGNENQDSPKDFVAFVSRRPNGAFSHNVRAQDWDISDQVFLGLDTGSAGIESLNVGPDEGFSRFRSSILYNEWQAGESAQASTAGAQ